MSFNRKLLSQMIAESKQKKTQPKPKDRILDPMGQWAHPGEITVIPGNRMATHGYGNIPLYVEANNGFKGVVLPNSGERYFPGATQFTEYPLTKAQNGITVALPHHQQMYNEELEKKRKWYEGRLKHENPKIKADAQEALDLIEKFPETISSDMVQYEPFLNLFLKGSLGRFDPFKNKIELADPNKLFPEKLPNSYKRFKEDTQDRKDLEKAYQLSQAPYIQRHEWDHLTDFPILENIIKKQNKDIYEQYIPFKDYYKLHKKDFVNSNPKDAFGDAISDYHWATGIPGFKQIGVSTVKRMSNAEMFRALNDARDIFNIDPSKNSTSEEWQNIFEKARQKLFDKNISEEERMQYNHILELFRTRGNDPSKVSDLNNMIVEKNSGKDLIQSQNGGEPNHEERSKKAKDFLISMYNSPLFAKRYAAMTGRRLRNINPKEIEEYRNTLLNNLNTLYAAPFGEEPKKGEFYTGDDMSFPNLIGGVYYENPPEEGKPGHSVWLNKYFADQPTTTHEWSHGSTKSNTNLPFTPKIPFNYDASLAGYAQEQFANENKKTYLTDPTEIKGRKDAVAQFLQEQGVWDPTKKRFGKKQYNYLKNLEKEVEDKLNNELPVDDKLLEVLSQWQDISLPYRKKDTRRIFNEIVKGNDNIENVINNNNYLTFAQSGGPIVDVDPIRYENREGIGEVGILPNIVIAPHLNDQGKRFYEKILDQSYNPKERYESSLQPLWLNKLVAENIYPYGGFGHGESEYKIDNFAQRYLSQQLRDKKINIKQYKEKIAELAYNKEGKKLFETWNRNMSMPTVDPANVNASYDALYIHQGLPQKYNSFIKSQYKPTESKDPNATYYSLSPSLEKEIIEDLISYQNKDFINSSEKTRKVKGSLIAQGSLKNFKYSKGKDEKGDYISYYDVNDYDNPLDWIGNPFEIYGRIYLDPKTGKPKKRNGGDISIPNLEEGNWLDKYQIGGPWISLPKNEPTRDEPIEFRGDLGLLNTDYLKSFLPDYKRLMGVPNAPNDMYDRMDQYLNKKGMDPYQSAHILSFLNKNYDQFGDLKRYTPEPVVKRFSQEEIDRKEKEAAERNKKAAGKFGEDYFENGGDISRLELPKAQFGKFSNSPSRSDSLNLYKTALEIEKYYQNKGYKKTNPFSKKEVIAEYNRDKKYYTDYLKKKNEPLPNQKAIDADKKILDQKLKNLEKERLEKLKKYTENLEIGRKEFLKTLNQGRKISAKFIDKNTGEIKEINNTFPYSEYYKKINPYQFEQRELAHGFLDLRSPIPLYDTRITPQNYFVYKSPGLVRLDDLSPFEVISNSEQLKKQKLQEYADAVQIYMYDPLAVKPYDLRTPEEKILWEKLYGSTYQNFSKKLPPSKSKSKQSSKKQQDNGHLMTAQDWQDVNSNDYGEEEVKIRNVDQDKFDIYRLPGNKFKIVPKQKPSTSTFSYTPKLKIVGNTISKQPFDFGTPSITRQPNIQQNQSGDYVLRFSELNSEGQNQPRELFFKSRKEADDMMDFLQKQNENRYSTGTYYGNLTTQGNYKRGGQFKQFQPGGFVTTDTTTLPKETRYLHNPSVGGKTDYAIRRTVTPYKTEDEIRKFTEMPMSGEDVDFLYWYRNASNKKDAMSVPFKGDKHWNIDRGIIDVEFGKNYPNLNQSGTTVEQNRNNVLADMYKYYMLQYPDNKDKAWREAKRFVRKEIDPRINNEYFRDVIINKTAPNTGTLTGFGNENPFKRLQDFNQMFVDNPELAFAYHRNYNPSEWTMDRMKGIAKDYLRDYKGLSRRDTRRQLRDWENELKGSVTVKVGPSKPLGKSVDDVVLTDDIIRASRESEDLNYGPNFEQLYKTPRANQRILSKADRMVEWRGLDNLPHRRLLRGNEADDFMKYLSENKLYTGTSISNTGILNEEDRKEFKNGGQLQQFQPGGAFKKCPNGQYLLRNGQCGTFDDLQREAAVTGLNRALASNQMVWQGNAPKTQVIVPASRNAASVARGDNTSIQRKPVLNPRTGKKEAASKSDATFSQQWSQPLAREVDPEFVERENIAMGLTAAPFLAPIIGSGLAAAGFTPSAVGAALNTPILSSIPWSTTAKMIGLGFGLKGASDLGKDIETGYYSSNAPLVDKITKGVETGLNIGFTPGMGNALFTGYRNAGRYLTNMGQYIKNRLPFRKTPIEKEFFELSPLEEVSFTYIPPTKEKFVPAPFDEEIKKEALDYLKLTKDSRYLDRVKALDAEARAAGYESNLEDKLRKFWKQGDRTENIIKTQDDYFPFNIKTTDYIPYTDEYGVTRNALGISNLNTSGFIKWVKEGPKSIQGLKFDPNYRKIEINLPRHLEENIPARGSIHHELKHHWTNALMDEPYYSNFLKSSVVPNEVNAFLPRRNFKYFTEGTEIDAYLMTNMRDEMVKKGILKDHFDELTKEKLIKFLRENPSYRAANEFFKPSSEIVWDKNKFVSAFNKALPALVPTIIGAGAMQQKKKGGQTNNWLENYN